MAELGRAERRRRGREGDERTTSTTSALTGFHEKYDYFLTPTISRKPP